MYVPVEPHPEQAPDPIIVSLPEIEPQQIVTDDDLRAIAVRYGEYESYRIEEECGFCAVCHRRIYDPGQTGLCAKHQDRADLRSDMEGA